MIVSPFISHTMFRPVTLLRHMTSARTVAVHVAHRLDLPVRVGDRREEAPTRRPSSRSSATRRSRRSPCCASTRSALPAPSRSPDPFDLPVRVGDVGRKPEMETRRAVHQPDDALARHLVAPHDIRLAIPIDVADPFDLPVRIGDRGQDRRRTRRSLPFMSHAMFLPVTLWRQMTSALPSASKSPTPLISQFVSAIVGRKAENATVNPSISHAMFCPVRLLRQMHVRLAVRVEVPDPFDLPVRVGDGRQEGGARGGRPVQQPADILSVHLVAPEQVGGAVGVEVTQRRWRNKRQAR